MHAELRNLIHPPVTASGYGGGLESSKDLALFAIHICVPTILVPYVIYSAITLTIVPNSLPTILKGGLPWLNLE